MLLSLKSRSQQLNPAHIPAAGSRSGVALNDVRSRDIQILQLINTPVIQQESHSVLSKVTLSL